MPKIYDRKNKNYYIENQYSKKVLKFLYNTKFGRLILKILVNKSFSYLMSLYYNGFLSLGKIDKFIKTYNISMQDFEKKNYSSFNDFFTRKMISQNIDEKPEILISPASSKLMVYSISEEFFVDIKNSRYSLKDLLKDEKIAKKYKNGICLVFRLTVDDYHRYCYIDSGKVEEERTINGKLHTVSSISNQYKIFIENQRQYQLLNTKNLGLVVQMEVGAILVGKIVNYDLKLFAKGEEKGYFSFGGSTIIILIQENKVKIDEDIIKNSKQNIETKVSYGEGIGVLL